MTRQMLTLVYVERFGAVDRIVSLLRRRGFPIAGIALERTHEPGIGRMSVAVSGDAALEQVARHLERLPDVRGVTVAGREECVEREFALLRVRCTPEHEAEVTSILAAFDARPLSTSADSLVVEVSGSCDDLDALFARLEPYGIEESARTNPMALGCHASERAQHTA